MTRRERLEAKLEKREQWAASRDAEGHRRFERACEAAKQFENGQPILVGHHSEKKARAAYKRVDDNMRASVENSKMANYHRSKAAGLADKLGSSIFSDDSDAVERLEEKIANLEKMQKIMVMANKIFRTKHLTRAEKIEQLNLLLPKRSNRDEIADFPSWALTNNNANIRRCKLRLEEVKARRKLLERAAANGNGIIIDPIYHGRMSRITFSEKPERDTIKVLKDAGFHWNGTGWIGDTDRIPDEVKELVGGTAYEQYQV